MRSSGVAGLSFGPRLDRPGPFARGPAMVVEALAGKLSSIVRSCFSSACLLVMVRLLRSAVLLAMPAKAGTQLPPGSPLARDDEEHSADDGEQSEDDEDEEASENCTCQPPRPSRLCSYRCNCDLLVDKRL